MNTTIFFKNKSQVLFTALILLLGSLLIMSMSSVPEILKYEYKIINIGSNDETAVIKLAEIIAKEMGIDPKTIIKKDAPEGSVNRRMPDIKKVKKLAKWKPKTKLREGLKQTVKWYMEEA